MNQKSKENEGVVEKVTFSKSAILGTDKYAHRRDLLQALLKEKSYSFSEVDALIETFMKGKVK